MKTILALQGRGKTGKTTTIRLLRNKLIRRGFVSIYPLFRNTNDFVDILQRGRVKVGVTTQGDLYRIIKTNLNILESYDCDVMICACRTKGRTINAVTEYKKYERTIIPKLTGNTLRLRRRCNNIDAKYLLESVLEILLVEEL